VPGLVRRNDLPLENRPSLSESPLDVGFPSEMRVEVSLPRLVASVARLRDEQSAGCLASEMPRLVLGG
jgi:hypothetical protein